MFLLPFYFFSTAHIIYQELFLKGAVFTRNCFKRSCFYRKLYLQGTEQGVIAVFNDHGGEFAALAASGVDAEHAALRKLTAPPVFKSFEGLAVPCEPDGLFESDVAGDGQGACVSVLDNDIMIVIKALEDY